MLEQDGGTMPLIWGRRQVIFCKSEFDARSERPERIEAACEFGVYAHEIIFASTPLPRQAVLHYLASGMTVAAHKTSRVTFVLTVRIPREGIEDFRAYEDAVLPLLPEFNGRLERRLRNPDGTMEVHIVSFESEADFQNLSE